MKGIMCEKIVSNEIKDLCKKYILQSKRGNKLSTIKIESIGVKTVLCYNGCLKIDRNQKVLVAILII